MEPYFIYRTSDNKIVGWGLVQSGNDPAVATGQAFVKPSQTIYDSFIGNFDTNASPYLYPNYTGGSYWYAQISNTSTGEFGTVSLSGTMPPVGAGSVTDEARDLRNRLLADCDWTQLSDVDLTSTCVANFATYRQDLRDVPEQGGFPSSITWPTRPTEVKNP